LDKQTLAHKEQIRQQQLNEALKAMDDIAPELERLVSTPAYKYAKKVSMSYVIKPYECDPPEGADDRTQWETYNTIRWAFERFFGLIEASAKRAPHLTKDQSTNANNRGQSD
jgi:hypothetical protein